MSREVLFKAKLKDWKTNPEHNRWIEGFYLKRKETTYCFKEDYEKYPVKTLHFIAEEHMTDWGLQNTFELYEIDPDTLCQYTGFTDENDNRIWENDIVNPFSVLKGIVKFGERDYSKEFGFYIEWISESCYRNDFLYWVDKCEECEVIGNIFDNKELVEGREKE